MHCVTQTRASERETSPFQYQQTQFQSVDPLPWPRGWIGVKGTVSMIKVIVMVLRYHIAQRRCIKWLARTSEPLECAIRAFYISYLIVQQLYSCFAMFSCLPSVFIVQYVVRPSLFF
ncbi:hypothetical protein NPIL_193301 [Nephila pilipes]|uniref:Uncharacterized protein n=1 Tax=Nephila pilipes TaxID=299642 RepID=A0A8X6NG08_NEPPI|nr:hypothetical protein NPIL_193301 [Nephila pilipes]